MEEKKALRDSYFAELDPEQRRKLLEQFAESNSKDAEVQLLRELWTLRYTDGKNPKQPVDTFLWQIINLTCLYRLSSFYSKGTEKEIDAAMATLGFSAANEFGEAGRKILYLEFQNAAHRYFETCENKFYGKKLLGIVTMNENERRDKMAHEIWQLTEGLTGRFKTNEEMALFCRAVRDEFITQCPDGETRLRTQQDRHRKKRSA